uniref:Peptidase S1 domain-containing protein n=1 Tax=Lygus hesperus TaxID=30085 RepID=A0A0A9YRL3_LYGHE
MISLDTQLIYECSQGYNLPVSPDGSPVSDTYCMEDYTPDGFQGGWNNNITCQKNCPPVFSETMDLECDFYGNKVPCEKARQGTILKPRCKPFYQPQEPVTVYNHTICLDTGKWRDPLYKCVPVCGIAGNSMFVHYIANGETARIGDHPWAISLYRKEKENNYKAVCGGTIISYNLVLSAAHCLYDDETGELVPASRFEVAMGKLNISWDSQEPTQQKIGVKELVWPTSYKGADRKYERDIAVLVLVRSIKFSSFTMPACIDWKKKGVFHNGEPGNIAGWGLDKTEHPSPILQSAILPYKDLETCRKDFSNYNLNTHGHQTGFNYFLTYDKICAGTDDDSDDTTSVQRGDSGGGLTIIRNNQHFLIGILSAHQKRNNRFAAYTSVAEYINWLSANKFLETLT